jgi:PAS domain S-box-containing protein
MEIMAAVLLNAYIASPQHLSLLTHRGASLSLQHGNGPWSPFFYSVVVLLWGGAVDISPTGESAQTLEEAHKLTKVLLSLLENPKYARCKAKSLDAMLGSLNWYMPMRRLLDVSLEIYQAGLDTGDLLNAGLGIFHLANFGLASGMNLNEYIKTVSAYRQRVIDLGQDYMYGTIGIGLQTAQNLMTPGSAPDVLEGRHFDELQWLPDAVAANDGFTLFLVFQAKLLLSYHFDRDGRLMECVGEAEKYLDSVYAMINVALFRFYDSLSRLRLYSSLSADERELALKRVESNQLSMRIWAQSGPMSFQHKFDLVAAEMARVSGDIGPAIELYERAIEGARDNEFIHEEALANELYARFWQERGNDKIAETYMREACLLYKRWGADAKVGHLEERDSHWFQAKTILTREPDTPDGADKVHTTITQPVTPIQLDMESILSASQMLSAETDLEQLLKQMMALVMANSGADKAILLLSQEDGWFVQARGDSTTEKYDILLNQPFEPADSESDIIPEPVFNYCQRSREVLVVGDAQLDHRFAEDRMIQKHNIQSMACIPVSSQGKLKAMLYLENRQTADVFNLENVEILKHLSSQFGVSVENALLYDRLNQKVRDLQESEERYHLAVTGAAAGIWDWDISSDTVHYSDRFKELLGYESGDFSDSPDEFWNRLHPDDYQATRQTVDRHLKERIPFRIDYRFQVKSGHYRWFHARGQAIWDETGRATRMSGSLTDITERKQVEEELRRSEEQFRSLMEGSPLAIEILTPDGQISQVNAAWLRLWGVNEEETAEVLANYNMLNDDQIVEQGIMPLVESAFSGQPAILPPFQYHASQATEEIGLGHIKGLSPWIQCHLYSVKDASDEISYVVNIYMDITELRRAEQEALEQREALARLDRTTSMGQLTGSISHELNQPLTGILSNAQAAELMIQNDQWEDDEMAEIMADISADAKRAGDVIRNLRALYREQRVEFLPIDINAIVEETIQLLHSEFIIQRVVLTTEYASSMPWLNGNKIQVQQVLVNLVMNGNQAMSDKARDERRIHIVTAYDTTEVKAWVEDNGSGIEPDRIDRIFEPLATWKPGHTGMGLAIGNSIIIAHGGRMWAENRPEGGARVGFALPVLKEELQQ